MELKDTIKLMMSDNYEDRFRAEYFQLKKRTIKLCAFLRKYKNKELNFEPKTSYEFFEMQWQAMMSYMLILESRAKIENIDLTIE